MTLGADTVLWWLPSILLLIYSAWYRWSRGIPIATFVYAPLVVTPFLVLAVVIGASLRLTWPEVTVPIGMSLGLTCVLLLLRAADAIQNDPVRVQLFELLGGQHRPRNGRVSWRFRTNAELTDALEAIEEAVHVRYVAWATFAARKQIRAYEDFTEALDDTEERASRWLLLPRWNLLRQRRVPGSTGEAFFTPEPLRPLDCGVISFAPGQAPLLSLSTDSPFCAKVEDRIHRATSGEYELDRGIWSPTNWSTPGKNA